MAKKRSSFDVVFDAARALPDVERITTSEASALKVGGRLLACQAIHKSAEPNSIMVRVPIDQRAELIASDPDVYYVTDHYVNYPSVLVRLSRIHRDSLHDLLSMAWQFANRNAPTRRRTARKRAR